MKTSVEEVPVVRSGLAAMNRWRGKERSSKKAAQEPKQKKTKDRQRDR